jgi:hypothetical protein
MPSDSYLGLQDARLRDIASDARRAFFRKRLWERDQGRCGICGEPVALGVMDVDHIVPRSQGGLTHWDNLRPAHRHCNRSRSDERRRERAAASPRHIESPVKFLMRLPADLYDHLRRLANDDTRSLNGELIFLLREFVRQRAAQTDPRPR